MFFFYLPLSSEFSHTSPGSDNDSSWSTSSDAGSGIDSSVPGGVAVELVLSKSLGSEHQNRAALWTISIFVWVAGNRGDTWHSEIVLVFELVTKFLNKWVDVRAKAAVRVASNSVALSKCSDLFSWVVVSESVLWARGDEADSIRINVLLELFEISLEIFGNWNLSALNLEVHTGLVESAMSSLGHDDVWLGDSSLLLGLFSVSEHSKDNRFSSSGCNNTAGLLSSFVEVKSPTDNFSLHGIGVIELINVKRVGHENWLHGV